MLTNNTTISPTLNHRFTCHWLFVSVKGDKRDGTTKSRNSKNKWSLQSCRLLFCAASFVLFWLKNRGRTQLKSTPFSQWKIMYTRPPPKSLCNFKWITPSLHCNDPLTVEEKEWQLEPSDSTYHTGFPLPMTLPNHLSSAALQSLYLLGLNHSNLRLDRTGLIPACRWNSAYTIFTMLSNLGKPVALQRRPLVFQEKNKAKFRLRQRWDFDVRAVLRCPEWNKFSKGTGCHG